MANTGNKQGKEMNPYLQEISDNLNKFIENINCLRETYEYSERTLLSQKKEAEKHYNDFIKAFINEETGELDIPARHFREYLKKDRKKKRAERAMTLVPPSYLVSLVSLYDLFLAGIVRLIYRIAPDKLKESNKSFTYKDLCEYKSVQEVKVLIVDETIESLLRESHVKQFDWLEKRLDISTLKKFDEWPDFVELTERRNLFVHSDGVVSQQYLDECQKQKAKLEDGVVKGSQLEVSKDYFEKAYRILYIVGIKLTQMLAHTIYKEQYPDDTSSIDGVLITNVYDLITEELYDVAISVSKFAHENKHFAHNANDKCYILLNFAQAYKWAGHADKCKELLDKEDCTVWKDELLIPKLTLENRFDEVYVKMRSVGSGSEILTPENYRQWPIFKEIRKEPEFAKVFQEIFDEDLEISIPMKVENKEATGEGTETSAESDKSKGFFFIFTDPKAG